MRITFVILFLLVTVAAVSGQDAIPVAKLTKEVSVNYDPQDLDWLQYGGTVNVTVLVDKNGKVKFGDLIGPMAPCGDLTNKRITSIRKAVTDALEKTTFQPATGADGKPVDSGMTLRIKVPNRKPGAVLSLPPVTRDKGVLNTTGTLGSKARELGKPDYPPAARLSHANGYVNVAVLVDENGKPIAAAAINGDPLLRLPATDAACHSKFEPTLVNGTPVKVTGILDYKFVAP